MKDFIKYIIASFLGLLLFVSIAGLLTLVLTQETPPEVAPKAFLVIDLTQPVADKPAVTEPARLVEDTLMGAPVERITLLEVTEAIDRAAKDDRVVGIYLHGTVTDPGLSSGWATLKEIREELLRFKSTGKQIVAFNMTYSEREYYLASLADRILIHPAGLMELNGFCAETFFYARAFEKVGLEVQIARVGRFKSAVEPFISSTRSPESREQLRGLLEVLFQDFVGAVAGARGLSPDQLIQITETRGILQAQDALDCGLVDEALFFDEVLDELKSLAGSAESDPTFPQVSLDDYNEAREAQRGSPAHGEPKIAVIYVEGDLVDGRSTVQAGGDTVAQFLRQARRDGDVKAVVLRVNSPGGSASAAEVVLREVKITRKAKPVVVSMGSQSASGGYWIASCANEILAEPNTITGSIGVFGLFPNARGLMQKVGIDVDVVKTSPLADVTSYYRPKTDVELQLFQRLLDRVYEDFLDRVAEGRNMERETVDVIAQGQVWSGRDAHKLGLVDSLGGLREALERAAALSNIGDDYALELYQQERSFLEDLFTLVPGEDDRLTHLGPDHTQVSPLMSELRRWLENARGNSLFSSRSGIYARLPYDLTIR